MNPRLFLALCVALFGLFATQALAADTCLGIPFSAKDKTCGGTSLVPCPVGQYCDKTAACVATKALDAACEDNAECGMSATCRGATDAKKCVSVAGPGQTCSSDSEAAEPHCYQALGCNVTSNKCYNGAFGDGCTSDVDCASGKCTGGACDGPVGTSCSFFGVDVCSPSNYCDAETFTCTARLAAGASCSYDQCVSTAVCTRTVSGGNRTCVAKGTIVAGSYSDSEEACQSGISYNNYCLTGSPIFCTSDNDDGTQCPADQVCLCGGNLLIYGYGKCGKFSCYSTFAELETCMEQCKGASLSTFSYSNSCANLKCKAAFDAVVACNPVFFNLALGFENNGPTKKK